MDRTLLLTLIASLALSFPAFADWTLNPFTGKQDYYERRTDASIYGTAGWTRGTSTVWLTTSTDKVGIGTTSPAWSLSVQNTADAITGTNVDVSNLTATFRHNSDDTNQAVGLGFGLSSTNSNIGAAIIHKRLGSNSYGDMYFATKPSGAATGADIPIRMTIASGGNVGIGTTAPAQTLDVNGTIYGHGNVGIGTSVARALLDVEGVVYMMGNVGIGTTAPRALIDVNGTTYLGGATTLSAQLNIVGAGNVGIGSSAPQHKLDVEGSVYFGTIGTGLVRSTAGLLSTDSTVYQTQLNGAGLVRMAGTVPSYDATVYQTNNSQWTTSGTNIYSTLAGSVGIGSTAPAQKLDVNGTIYGHGNVGIGTSVARALLDVEGAVYMMGNVGIGTSSAIYTLQVGSPDPTLTAGTSAKQAVKGNFAVDGIIYNNGIRIGTDGAIYSFVAFSYFKTGTVCRRCPVITGTTSCGVVTCASVGM